MLRAADPAGWVVGFTSGGVWGMAFFSWGLPLPIPARVLVTVLLLLALSASSRPGMLAAGAFALGMGATSSLMLALSGSLLTEWWGLVPATSLVGGVGLHAVVLLRDAV